MDRTGGSGGGRNSASSHTKLQFFTLPAGRGNAFNNTMFSRYKGVLSIA